MIDAYLWKLQLASTKGCVFAVNSTLPPYLQGGGSTRCMWSREKFDKITLMLIPLNLFG